MPLAVSVYGKSMTAHVVAYTIWGSIHLRLVEHHIPVHCVVKRMTTPKRRTSPTTIVSQKLKASGHRYCSWICNIPFTEQYHP